MSLFSLPRGLWCSTPVSALALLMAAAAPLRASRVDIKPPPGASIGFGREVKLLSNGKVIVVDEYYTPPETGVQSAGCVFLYGPDGALLSRLMGVKREDRVGGGGVTVLAGGDFTVGSPRWDSGDLVDAGAVTWRSGTADTDEVVSAENSLTGGNANDQVGDSTFRNPANNARGGGGVVALRNGNYVICSPSWNGARGAVTWARGDGPAAGVVSEANSLTGAAPDARVGFRFEGGGVTELANGHYVVNSPYAGMVTWCDGAAATAGVADAGNSLLTGARAPGRRVTALAGGAYAVSSPNWDGGRGAVTWCPGEGGRAGAVTAENSLTGRSPDDGVGGLFTVPATPREAVTALKNGSYVVASPRWGREGARDAGAVTWCAADGSTTGPVTEANSVTGTSASDFVGRVTALSSGDYVVSAEMWDRGDVRNAGATRLLPGSGPSTGELTPENSLIGSAAENRVSLGGVAPLTNGNYVVLSPAIGAVTWVDGVAGRTGPVTEENSLTGAWFGYRAGGTGEINPNNGGVAVLTNGNYVVVNPEWGFNRGAVTWGDGTRGLYGKATEENSLTGGDGFYLGGYNVTSSTFIAVPGTAAANGEAPLLGVTPLANGNYVVSSPTRSLPGQTGRGAVTWCSGAGPTTVRVDAANSLTPLAGSQFAPAPQLGTILPIPFPDGSYMQLVTDFRKYNYSSVTPLSGTGVTAARISAANSEMGGALDQWPSVWWSTSPPLAKLMGFDPSRRRVVVSNMETGLVSLYGNLVPNAAKMGVWRPAQPSLASGHTLDFGDVGPGSETAARLDITSYGASPLVFSVAQSGDPAFRLDLGTEEHTLAQGGRLRVRLSLTAPAEPGERRGVFHILSNDPDRPDFVLNVRAAVTVSTPSLSRDLVTPPGGGAFGADVQCLPNGNIVVTDPEWDGPGSLENAGAAYLYSPEGALISRFTGAAAGDRVGEGGVTVLTNGNYVIRSGPLLDAEGRCAVTWADGATGVSGTLSAENSLTSPTHDRAYVIPLPNGNYVVAHYNLKYGIEYLEHGEADPLVDGAVTWGDGSRGVAGTVSAANSLTGPGTGIRGELTPPGGGTVSVCGVTVLPNGNYVVTSRDAVTLGSAAVGVAGAVSEENSLVFPAGAAAGTPAVTVLTDGNYVACVPYLTVDGAPDTGAIVWGDGAAERRGAFRVEDALTGGNGYRLSGAVYALPGGRYAVGSLRGAPGDTGALTWCAAGGVTAGRVSAENSLLGFLPGLNPVTASPEGNVLVTVRLSAGDIPGVVRMSVAEPLTGEPAPERMLSGEKGDVVGERVALLDDGNFVVTSVMSQGGAVTWVDGRLGREGRVTAENSLTGRGAGRGGVTPLGGGRYVVCSPGWDPAGETPGRGAVTWMDGPADGAGSIHEGNSITGATRRDETGATGVVRLAGGNYVIRASFGRSRAVTWADGSRPSAFQVSEANSLILSNAHSIVYPLCNGHYVVLDMPLITGARGVCRITWGNGRSGVSGPVSPLNSVTGETVDNERLGYSFRAERDGAYSVLSPNLADGAGGVVLGAGGMDPAQRGPFSHGNSVRGEFGRSYDREDERPLSISYDPARKRWAVGRPYDNVVTLFSHRLPAAGRLAMEEAGGVDLPDGADVDFGKVETGLLADRVVTLRNTGGGALRLGAPSVEGAAEFAIVSGPADGAEIPPGGSAELVLRFTAGGPGVRTGALRIASDDPAVATVGLRGVVAPAAEWPFGDATAPPEITPRAEGGVTVRFSAVAGATYQLQRSRDLVTWEPAGLVMADDSGVVTFTDAAPSAPTAYYRLKTR